MPPRADSEKEFRRQGLLCSGFILNNIVVLHLFSTSASRFVVDAIVPQTSTYVKPTASAKFLRHSKVGPLRVNPNRSLVSENSSLSRHSGSALDALFNENDAEFEEPQDANRELFSAPTVFPTAAVVCQIGDEDKDADLSCTFDDNSDNNGLCKFTLPTGTGAETTFTRRSGGTPTSLTGPSGDSSASGDGYYMYSEASGMTATEVQLELRVNHTFCSQGVSFWYHMYGSGIGTLALSVSRLGTDYTTVWSKTGLQNLGSDAPWQFATVQTRSMTLPPVFFFKFTHTPDSDTGDVAIDDFAIIDLPTPAPTPAPSRPTLVPFPAPTEQPTYMPTPAPTLTLIPTPAPSPVPTYVPTPSPTTFASFFTILTTRNAVIGAAIFVTVVVFALALAAVRRGACASKRDLDDIEAEKTRLDEERALQKKKVNEVVDKQRAKEMEEQVADSVFYRAQALEARRQKHAERKAARKAANPQSNNLRNPGQSLAGRLQRLSEDRGRILSNGSEAVERFSRRISKGFIDVGKTAKSIRDRSFSFGRLSSSDRLGINDSIDPAKSMRRSTKNKSKRQSKSRSLAEHLHRKPLRKRSDLEELIAFLAPIGLEDLAPRFASAGLLKKIHLLELNNESLALNALHLNDTDRRKILNLVLTSRIASRRQGDPFGALGALGFISADPPKLQTTHADTSRGNRSLTKGDNFLGFGGRQIYQQQQQSNFGDDSRGIRDLTKYGKQHRQEPKQTVYGDVSRGINSLVRNQEQQQQQQHESNYADSRRGNRSMSKNSGSHLIKNDASLGSGNVFRQQEGSQTPVSLLPSNRHSKAPFLSEKKDSAIPKNGSEVQEPVRSTARKEARRDERQKSTQRNKSRTSEGASHRRKSSLGDCSRPGTQHIKDSGAATMREAALPLPSPIPSRLGDRVKEQEGRRRTEKQVSRKLEKPRHSMDQSKVDPAFRVATIGTPRNESSSFSRRASDFNSKASAKVKLSSVPTSTATLEKQSSSEVRHTRKVEKVAETPRSMLDDVSDILGFQL